MKFLPFIVPLLLLLAGCKEQLSFKQKKFVEKSTMPCKEQCPQISLTVTIAKNGALADSINKNVFNTLKGIIYFGEKPYPAKTYDALLKSFIASYEQIQKGSPDEIIGWEGEIESTVSYQSSNIINIEIEHYTFTGGAHGYSGKRSLIFNTHTGKLVTNSDMFLDKTKFLNFAELQFRRKFKIADRAPINEGGLMFENERFHLPENIFYTSTGIVLYYNAYEIASYAEGAQELLIPYNIAQSYLKVW